MYRGRLVAQNTWCKSIGILKNPRAILFIEKIHDLKVGAIRRRRRNKHGSVPVVHFLSIIV